MAIGIVGRKAGMTRIFTEDGQALPVTVIEVDSNRITQLKTLEIDGYRAVQITVGSRRSSRVNKSAAGHFAKAGVTPRRHIIEVRTPDASEYILGQELTAGIFETGQVVDVVGTTKGKGFAGVMKRHGFHGLRASHGVKRAHRSAGSIGACATPGRVFKGKKMAGRMGGDRQTTQNLKVQAVDIERGLILIKGAIPGSKGGIVFIHSAAK